MKKLLLSLLLFTAMIITLAFYNYRLAQKRLAEARPTQFGIELIDVPSAAAANTPVKLTWSVDAPNSFSTTKTGIYWSYDSSPSALLKGDSPEAVNYANFTFDYATGVFQLPDTFDLDLSFTQKGVVYFRAYAQIDKDHLWTEEGEIIVK